MQLRATGGIMNWLKQLFARKSLDHGLDGEIAFRLENRIKELAATGLSIEEATAAVHKEFAGVMLAKEKAREAWVKRRLGDFAGDLRFGLRMLRKNPVLTVVAVLTLALGVGANSAIFTLLYGLVLRSLPASHAGQMVKVGIASKAEPDDPGEYMPYRMMQAMGQQQSSFRELSAWSADWVLMRDHEGSIQGYMAGLVCGNAVGVLGIEPYRGRLLAAYDDVRGGPSGGWPVVLS